MRYRIPSMFIAVAIASLLFAGYNRCAWYGGGFAESLATSLRALQNVESVHFRGFSDAPCDYSMLELVVIVAGGPEDRVVVFDCQPESPITKYQILGIGPYVLWTSTENGQEFGRPDFGDSGLFANTVKANTTTPIDAVNNYDLLLSEIEDTWPRENGQSSIESPSKGKVYYWATARTKEYSKTWNLIKQP